MLTAISLLPSSLGPPTHASCLSALCAGASQGASHTVLLPPPPTALTPPGALTYIAQCTLASLACASLPPHYAPTASAYVPADCLGSSLESCLRDIVRGRGVASGASRYVLCVPPGGLLPGNACASASTEARSFDVQFTSGGELVLVSTGLMEPAAEVASVLPTYDAEWVGGVAFPRLVASAVRRYGLCVGVSAACGGRCSGSGLCSSVVAGGATTDRPEHVGRTLRALLVGGWYAPLNLPSLTPAALLSQEQSDLLPRLEREPLLALDAVTPPTQAPPLLPWRIAIFGGAFSPITLAHTSVAQELLEQGCTDEVWLVPCGPRADKPTLSAALPSMRHAIAVLGVEAALPAAMGVHVVPLELWEGGAMASYDLMSRLEAASAGVGAGAGTAAGHGAGAGAGTGPDPFTDARMGTPIEFSLVIGGDLLPQLHRWRSAPQLLAEVRFLLVPRPQRDVPTGGRGTKGASGAPSGDWSDDSSIPPSHLPRRLALAVRRDGSAIETPDVASSDVRERCAEAMTGARVGQRWSHEEAGVALHGLVHPAVALFVWAQGLYG